MYHLGCSPITDAWLVAQKNGSPISGSQSMLWPGDGVWRKSDLHRHLGEFSPQLSLAQLHLGPGSLLLDRSWRKKVLFEAHAKYSKPAFAEWCSEVWGVCQYVNKAGLSHLPCGSCGPVLLPEPWRRLCVGGTGLQDSFTNSMADSQPF
jgi:hypothetical protein